MDRCGLPRELFTPTFAVSRVIGWCANIAEQAAERQLIRPAARYVGPPPPGTGAGRALSHRPESRLTPVPVPPDAGRDRFTKPSGDP